MIISSTNKDNAIRRAAVMAGGTGSLASFLGVSTQVINRWIHQGWAPKERARQIADKFNISIERMLDPKTLAAVRNQKPDTSTGKISSTLLSPVHLSENQEKQFAIINFQKEDGDLLLQLMNEMKESENTKKLVDLSFALLNFIQSGVDLSTEQERLLKVITIA